MPNVDDVWGFPSYLPLEKLEGRGAFVSSNDSHIPVIGFKRESLKYVGRKSVKGQINLTSR